MISTESMLSQFHLANSSTGTNALHYLSNDKKQHVAHKYSQSLDANSSYNTPYISISECYSETHNNRPPSIYKQQQQQQPPKPSSLNLVQHHSNVCSFDQDHLKSTLNFNNKLSLLNKQFLNKPTNESRCDSRVILHTRSNSNIVLGSKKQYSPQQSNHLNSPSVSSNQKFYFHQMQDRSTNRHFKVYEKNELANASLIANSTSLIDVSQTSSSLLKSSVNSHQQQRSISSLRPWESNLLSEKLNNLSLNNNYLNQASLVNQSRGQYAPPRPPKPVNLRINNQLNSTSVSLNNNHSFNELFSTILNNSDEEYSPTATTKHYGSYYQFNSANQQSFQRPKNSLSSSCSSNASPYYNQNTQDLVFTYDQSLTNQSFNHSTSRLNSFEDNDSDRSPTYLNNLTSSNQASPKLNSSLHMPPAINRELKPRKVTLNDIKLNKFNHLNNSNSSSNSSYYQTNALINGQSNNLDDRLYDNNNFTSSQSEDHYEKISQHDETAIQYLDLDLIKDDDEEVSYSQQSAFKDDFKEQLNSTISSNESKELKDSKESHTVYKTLDFIKTKAVNNLRNNSEKIVL